MNYYKKDEIVVVGVGDSDYRSLYSTRKESKNYPMTLTYQAFKRALMDSGMTKDLIDGLVVVRAGSYIDIARTLGIRPKWSVQLPSAGRMAGVAIIEAISALMSGLCNNVALVYSNVGRSSGDTYGAEDRWQGLWTFAGMTSPGAYWAMIYNRYMHEFAAGPESLADIAITIRRHASMNPNAIMQKQITRDEYKSARFIAEPLRLYDYCLINDGSVCIILTIKDNARKIAKQPVAISGFGISNSFNQTYITQDLVPVDYGELQAKEAGGAALKMANISRNDIDALEIYDNFTPAVLFTLENFGYTSRGKGAEFTEDGNIGIDGKLPVNTSGGHLSESYMQGWNHLVEAVRQIRCEAGKRQIGRCDYIQYYCSTPVATSIVFHSS